MEKVAVIGASSKTDRYSNMAISLLKEFGHTVYPINPVEKTILGLKVYKNLDEIRSSIDTLSIYLNPATLEKELDSIIRLKPKRVIFNPGTESDKLINALDKQGIATVRGCTLVMLKSGQF